jgi:hypothetical protein
MSGLADPVNIKKAGKFAKVDAFMFVYPKVDTGINQFIVNIQMVDVTTSAFIWVEEFKAEEPPVFQINAGIGIGAFSTGVDYKATVKGPAGELVDTAATDRYSVYFRAEIFIPRIISIADIGVSGDFMGVLAGMAVKRPVDIVGLNYGAYTLLDFRQFDSISGLQVTGIARVHLFELLGLGDGLSLRLGYGQFMMRFPVFKYTKKDADSYAVPYLANTSYMFFRAGLDINLSRSLFLLLEADFLPDLTKSGVFGDNGAEAPEKNNISLNMDSHGAVILTRMMLTFRLF